MGMIFGNEAKHIAVFGRSFILNAQVTLQGKFKFFEQIYLLCLYLKTHSEAMAFANSIFPVSGWPASKTPCSTQYDIPL